MSTRYVRRIAELPEGILGAYGNVTIRRVVNPQLVDSSYLSINAIGLPAQFGTPLHVHYKSEEAWVVLEGEGMLRVDGGVHPFRAGDVLYVPAGKPHQVVTRGSGGLRYLAITAPPVDLENDNVILAPFDPEQDAAQ